MAWTTPRTWVPGEFVTALMLNTHVRDNLLARKAVVSLVDGETPALDASLGVVFRLAAAGDREIQTPANATSSPTGKIIIEHYADGAARTLSLAAAGFRFGTDVTELSETASGKTDYIGCIYNSTDNKWDVVAVAKGY